MEQIRGQTPVVLLSFMEESQVRIGRQAIFAKIAFFEDTYLTWEHKAKLLMASIRLKILPWMTQIHKGCVYDLLYDCSIRPYLCPMLGEFQRAMDPFSFKSQSKKVSKPQLQPQQKLGLTQLLICITINTRTKSTLTVGYANNPTSAISTARTAAETTTIATTSTRNLHQYVQKKISKPS